MVARADPHIGLLHRRDREAGGAAHVPAVGAVHGPAGLHVDDVQRARLRAGDREAAGDRGAGARARYIRVLFDEITRILNHLLWLGAHALDIGAMSMFLYAFREREDLLDCYEGGVGRAHARRPTTGRAGVYRDLPGSMPRYEPSAVRSAKDCDRLNAARGGSLLDFIADFSSALPGPGRRVNETLLTDNRIWKQRTVGIGVGRARAGAGAGLHRADAARLGRAVGTCGGRSPTRSTTGWTSRCRWAARAIPTTATWCGWRRCGRRTASSASAWTGCGPTRGR